MLTEDILCASWVPGRLRAQREHRGLPLCSAYGFLTVPCALASWVLHKPFPKPGIVLLPLLFACVDQCNF